MTCKQKSMSVQCDLFYQFLLLSRARRQCSPRVDCYHKQPRQVNVVCKRIVLLLLGEARLGRNRDSRKQQNAHRNSLVQGISCRLQVIDLFQGLKVFTKKEKSILQKGKKILIRVTYCFAYFECWDYYNTTRISLLTL